MFNMNLSISSISSLVRLRSSDVSIFENNSETTIDIIATKREKMITLLSLFEK